MRNVIADTEVFYDAVAESLEITGPSYRSLLITGVVATGCMIFTASYAATKGILFIGKQIQKRH